MDTETPRYYYTTVSNDVVRMFPTTSTVSALESVNMLLTICKWLLRYGQHTEGGTTGSSRYEDKMRHYCDAASTNVAAEYNLECINNLLSSFNTLMVHEGRGFAESLD
jgi:hypothetical protein